MTTKTARQELAILITSWLADPPAAFTSLDDSLIEVHRYTTAPDPNNARPYEIVIGTEQVTTASQGVDESDKGCNLYIAIFARIDTSSEATKEAAENFLDDCEEFLTTQMEASRNTVTWSRLRKLGSRRDPEPAFHKLFRTAFLRVGVDLR